MKPEKLISEVNKILSNRKYMYDNGLAFRTMQHLVAIGKVKKHIDLVKNGKEETVKKMIRFLEPELRSLMPGESSKFRTSMIETLENVLKECKQLKK